MSGPRLGILTSGGDCPGLNAVIRSAFIRLTREHGGELVGFRAGWKGVRDDDAIAVDESLTRGIAGTGGTVLGTSRTNPVDNGGVSQVRETIKRRCLDGLLAVGGEGSLAAAAALARAGIPVIGVPKTIDNDLRGTDYTFGFDTAVQIATDAIDRLGTTGTSHTRCMVAEVMGRHSGWIALHAGIATGAQAILVPEQPVPFDRLIGWIASARARGESAVVVVAEGYPLPGADGVYAPRGSAADGRPRLGGIGEQLASMIEAATGIETRATTLGHIQRGGTPTAYDRVLAARFGAAAVDAAAVAGWGQMVSLAGEDITLCPIEAAVGSTKMITSARYERAAVCFG